MSLFPVTLPFIAHLKSCQDNPLHCEQLLREIPGKRLVFAGTWRQRPVIVKLFLDSRSAQRYWAREKNGIALLKGTKVRTPQLLFSGQLTDDTLVLVFEYLPQAQTALQLWNSLDSEESRLSFMQQMVELIGKLHDAGLLQADLHLENFLFSDQKFYAIDGDAIRSEGRGKPLDMVACSRNLALFFAQIPPKHEPLMKAAAQHYANQRNLPGTLLLARLKLDLPNARRRRRHQYVKKSYRSCSEFFRSDKRGWVAVFRRDARTENLDRLLDDPDSYMRGGELLKDGKTSTVVRVQVDGCDWVIKRYNIKNPWHALSRCFRPTRAWISWGNAHRLKISGIATPNAVALIEKRFGPLRSTGYYVCDYLAGSTAKTFFQEEASTASEKEQAAREIVDLFELFFRLGISHGDCKATNFILKDNIPWVLDLDAMRECKNPERFKKLYRLDRQRFLSNWQSQPGLLRWFDDHLAR